MSKFKSIKLENSTLKIVEHDKSAALSHHQIAEQTCNTIDSVYRLIEKHLQQLELFGKVGFEIRASGKTNQKQKIYYLNEQQSTLLVTFMRNNEIVIKFKVELVKAFFEAKSFIQSRALSKLEFPELTEAIQEFLITGKDSDKWLYSTEADMINSTVLGCKAKKYCELNNIDRTCLRDNLSQGQINLIQQLQKFDTALIQAQLPYAERKEKIAIRYAQLVAKLLS